MKLSKWLIAMSVMACLLLLVLFLALRDNPTRAVSGERKTVANGNVEVHYFVSGEQTAPPVVLLASYARSVADFNELVESLVSAGYRTIAVQHRGIDGSSLVLSGNTFHDYAADLAAVLGSEKITGNRPVAIIGHAWGNRIARTYAANYPDEVRGLVLLAAGGETPTPPEVGKAIQKALFGIYPDSVRRPAIGLAFFAGGNEVPESWMRGWYPLAGLAQAGAVASTPFEQWGHGGSAPIVILQPLQDAAAPDGAYLLQQRYPRRVTLYEVDNTGHALLPERGEQVAQIVIEALAQFR